MADVTVQHPVIPAMDEAAIDNVRQLTAAMAELPQVPIRTEHILHAGLYARTVFVPAGVIITGVLIKIPTLLIVHGDALVYIGGASLRLEGYNVVPAAAGRRQAFVAESDLHLTMLFASDAASVDQAERQFTDEFEQLVSRKEPTCQA
jgi:hypothetical protein